MTMLEQHELAFVVLKWIGILILPAFYGALYFAVKWADRQEAIATEARRAETVQHGSVHEGAGRKASPKLPIHPQTTD